MIAWQAADAGDSIFVLARGSLSDPARTFRLALKSHPDNFCDDDFSYFFGGIFCSPIAIGFFWVKVLSPDRRARYPLLLLKENGRVPQLKVQSSHRKATKYILSYNPSI